LSTTKHSGIQKETMSDEIGVDVRGWWYVMKRTLWQDLRKLLWVS
jgi:hypothetical protein